MAEDEIDNAGEHGPGGRFDDSPRISEQAALAALLLDKGEARITPDSRPVLGDGLARGKLYAAARQAKLKITTHRDGQDIVATVVRDS